MENFISHEDHPTEEINISVNDQQHWICTVKENIRKKSEDSYTPEYVSIGPLHREKPELANMQKEKSTHFSAFLLRINTAKLRKMKKFVGDNEERIRKFYEGESKLFSCPYREMVLLDAVFILELFLRYYEKSILLNNQYHQYTGITRDLLLFENQLPYFLLEELYILASPVDGAKQPYPPFMALCCKFFRKCLPNNQLSEVEGKHFLDMIRCALLKNHPTAGQTGSIVHFSSAVELKKCGVNFKSFDGEGMLNVRFRKKRGQLEWFKKYNPPWFKEGQLLIPKLIIKPITEDLIRNLIALEDSCYTFEAYICDYILLMGYLINSKEDVGLLLKEHIIEFHHTDPDKVVKMIKILCEDINKVLCKDISYYGVLSQSLCAYIDDYWNRTKAEIKRDYFNSFWKVVGGIFSVIIFVSSLIVFVQKISEMFKH
ncbi:hypothetical protein Q3G72_006148 [Acer saccharum]|nr:hypothetical protein Q3G72_006148 [Acer saccharum]